MNEPSTTQPPTPRDEYLEAAKAIAAGAGGATPLPPLDLESTAPGADDPGFYHDVLLTGKTYRLARKGWRELALDIAWNTWSDVHLKGGTALGFAFFAWGKFHPDVESACNACAIALGGFVSGSLYQKGSK